MNHTIYIIAEHLDGKIRPVTYELVAFARDLSAREEAGLQILVLGNDIEAMASEMAKATGLDVVGLCHDDLIGYNQELYAGMLGKFFEEKAFSFICMPHSTQGMDLAAALAVRTNAACITGVEGIHTTRDGTCFFRSLFNGKATATMKATAASTVLTVHPGVVKANGDAPFQSGRVTLQQMVYPVLRTRSKGLVRSRSDSRSVAEADIIVSAGRGVGKKENLDLIYQLAERFSKSAVGGSRPLCDLGWLGYQCQIGITGQNVSPELYVACGISGAVQHLSGIRGAGFIVAINTDPKAAIFNMADVCIVEDVSTFIPALIAALEENAAMS